MEDLAAQSQAWLASNGRTLALNLVTAIAIFYIGRWVAGMVRGWSGRLMRRARVEETLIGFGSNIAYALLMAFVIIAALGQLGIQTATFVAIVGAAGLAVGLALQGSLANFAAGVLIIMQRPFKAGDYVEAAGIGGTVEEIEIFQTRFRTADNKIIVVPNNAVTSGAITNYSTMPTRRCDLVIGVHYDSDLAEVRRLIMDIVQSDDRVLSEPAPVVVVGELADSAINILVRPWVKSSDFWPLRWDLLERIKTRLDSEGVVIAYPQIEIHLRRESAEG